MTGREKVISARNALLNGSGKLSYFEKRGIDRQTIEAAFIGYDAASHAFTYPCIARGGGLLGIHYKSEGRNEKGKRWQWWGGYAEDLPAKGHGRKPDDLAKVIPFGLETLQDLEPGSLVVLCCGEEDALSLRQAGFTAVSQAGAGVLEPVYAREFAGFDVVVVYDAGEEVEAAKDARKLQQAGAFNVRVAEWPPDAPHGADINGRLVEDPGGFKKWFSGVITSAAPLTALSESTKRAGEPDNYTSFVSFVPEQMPWPVLADEALYGLPGDIVRSIDPHTEADPVAVLANQLAGVLKVMSRDGNTLSPVIRQAWDDDRLQVMTRNNPMKATGAHVSIVGHITKAEHLRHLTETERANGFANRFMWFMVKRSKELPFGGEWFKVDTAPLVRRLSSALEFASAPVAITWGEDAREIWREVYGPLSAGKPGLFGAVVSRAEAQVVRLAALYAVMDKSYKIRKEHLLAALALWEYAEASARYIFGDATGDPEADQILAALRGAGKSGMTRTQISHVFGRNKKAERVSQALSLLLSLGRVRQEEEETGGRTAERWFAK
jgi:hypothetical protein